MSDYICTSCGYSGKRKAIKPGSRTVEWVLWLVLVVPGPFYTAWRILKRSWVCPQCGDEAMVKLDSRLGKLKMDEVNSDISDEELKKIPNMWQKDIEEYNKKHGIIHQPKTINKEAPKQDDKW